ncbi:cation-transporting P-type ATPase [Halioxenophilus sp. WMMB6]|uniref:cation-translocating P-type ATPase n=1 Tax=Halioxenophilus sp. WMMB6 TaxID=3073815 RepID=UPI00295EAAFB|nr:cation-transporting P-type ATPase [Halioxenophilus sp. WMMB6]
MQRSVPVQRLIDALDPQRGLSAEEASAQRRLYGLNTIVEASTPRWQLLQDTLKDPMLWFLLGTALLFLLLGDIVEAITLLLAVIPLIGMDLFLHRRTQAATESLQSQLASHAQVLREGQLLTVAVAELVPGDLVCLAAGQSVPADGIVIGGDAPQLDESVLTGESYPVRKRALAELASQAAELPVAAEHWLFAGTRLLTGSASLRVVFTGGETLYGEIVATTALGRRERTPLQAAIGNLVQVLLIAAILLCGVLAWVRLRQGFGVIDAILSAVTLAVAALPEEFPVVFTFFLGVGVYRLAQRRALVRRAVVVENIGRVSCICSDKTGTITEGQLQLAHTFVNGDVNSDSPLKAAPLVNTGESDGALLATAALASRRETGDPLDLAILQGREPEARALLVQTFPFTEDRKRETAIWRIADGSLLAAAKGAPETIFALCSLTSDALNHWQQQVQSLAATGHKVIACAAQSFKVESWLGGEPDRGFVLQGLLAFEDPVREGVSEAIDHCLARGIRVVMVTGDHPSTAQAVARQIGLGRGDPRVVTGSELDGLLARGPAALAGVDVVARAVPAQKLHLVQAFQRAGEIVAVTGDGVNDVPALQAADIGLAMGEHGTRSAREVAAIVLLDDNFRTIAQAIAEGRQLFTNLRLSFAYLLMIHIPLVLSAALIPLAGYPLLYLPIHIVWLELIIHPTALLVFQSLPAAPRAALPRRPSLHFFGRRQWLVIAAVGALISGLIILGYGRSLGAGGNVEHARAMTLVMLTFASATITVILSRLATRLARTLVAATLLTSLLLVQMPPLAALLHLAPLHLDDLLLSVAGGVLVAVTAALGRFGRV